LDYENAISSETAMLLKVHTSNYRIMGFTKEVSLTEMVPLGKKYNVASSGRFRKWLFS